MFKNILIPIDLTNADELQKSLKCAADLAKFHGANVTYVGVTGSAPTAFAHDEQEFSKYLETFAKIQSDEHDISVSSNVQHCNDLTTDVDDALLKAIDETGADLVVMQSHMPNITEYVWPSNGGKVARHAKVSVMIVRD